MDIFYSSRDRYVGIYTVGATRQSRVTRDRTRGRGRNGQLARIETPPGIEAFRHADEQLLRELLGEDDSGSTRRRAPWPCSGLRTIVQLRDLVALRAPSGLAPAADQLDGWAPPRRNIVRFADTAIVDMSAFDEIVRCDRRNRAY